MILAGDIGGTKTVVALYESTPDGVRQVSDATFPSADGTEIEGIFYLPPGYQEGIRYPTILRIHGGPAAQYKPYFSWYNQFLTRELGVAVLAPNVRGSTGYGKTFVSLDDGYRREDSVKDIGSLLDWVAAQPELDADREPQASAAKKTS